MNIIAIDCGASFVKGASFREGTKRREIKRGATGISREPLNTIRQIYKLQKIVKEMVLELCNQHDENILCISNEMHGFILTNDKGEPITDYISWQVDLGDQMLNNSSEMRGAIIRTGMPLRGGLPSSNLSWIINNHILKGKLYFYTLGDYLIRYLSGQEPSIHQTNAAATGLYDIIVNGWSKDIIDIIGADDVVFPSNKNNNVEFILDGIKVVALPAIGDQQAALLGAGLDNPETLSFNIGTGAQVSRITNNIELSREWQVRPYYNGLYLQTVPHIPSGRAINVYFRFIESVLNRYGVNISDEELWKGIEDAIADGDDTDMILDLGFFENSVNGSKTGSIMNIHEYELSINNLFFSIVCQIADNCCCVADRIWPQREYVKNILFSGGVANRYSLLRERINMRYSNAQIINSLGDTLEGLMKYEKMSLEL